LEVKLWLARVKFISYLRFREVRTVGGRAASVDIRLALKSVRVQRVSETDVKNILIILGQFREREDIASELRVVNALNETKFSEE